MPPPLSGLSDSFRVWDYGILPKMNACLVNSEAAKIEVTHQDACKLLPRGENVLPFPQSITKPLSRKSDMPKEKLHILHPKHNLMETRREGRS